jgi:PPM family protein phosphatase
MVDSASTEGEQSSKFDYHFAVQSDVGKRREENQDAFGYICTDDYSMFIVADGMGGARGGATASAIAVDVVIKYACDKSLGQVTEKSLSSAIQRANAVIYSLGKENEDFLGMGTTIVVLVLAKNKALIAHVGDSRIYQYYQGEINTLTRDHTLVKELIDSGAISAKQAENHPIAHMLTRSLGPTVAVEGESRILEKPIRAGEKFLLCSDGLYNLVKEKELCEILRDTNVTEAADRLVDLANKRGGTDNITVQIVEITKAGSTAAVIKPEHDVFVSREVGFDVDYDITFEEYVQPPEEVEEEVEEKSLDDIGKKPETPRAKVLEEDTVEVQPVTDVEHLRKQHRIMSVVVVLLVLVIGQLLYTGFKEQERAPLVDDIAKQEPEIAKREEAVKDLATWEPAQVDSEQLEQVREEEPELTRDEPRSSEAELTHKEEYREEPSEEYREEVVELDDVGRIIAYVSRMSVPPPPITEPPDLESHEDLQPIDWEAERMAREAMPETRAVSGDEQTTLISETEKKRIMEQKVSLRMEISDIDQNLLLYNATSPEELDAHREELINRIEELDFAIEQTMDNLEEARTRFNAWKERRERMNTVDIMDLASEVSLVSTDVKRRQEAYNIASLRYLDAVELWRENPSGDNLASQMAAFGRELKSRRMELRESIQHTLDTSYKQSAHDVTEYSLILSNLERHRGRLNRHIGFIQGFFQEKPENRIQRQRELLDARKQLVQELQVLQHRLSDKDELIYRRQTIFNQIGYNE